MNYDIRTDVPPKVNIIPEVKHEDDNWESPLMDKFNKASEYLKTIDSDAEFQCFFNSSKQVFTPEYERCIDLSKDEIDAIIRKINNL